MNRPSRLGRQDPASEADCNSLFRRQIDEAAAVAPFANLAYMASLVVILTYTVPPGRQTLRWLGGALIFLVLANSIRVWIPLRWRPSKHTPRYDYVGLLVEVIVVATLGRHTFRSALSRHGRLPRLGSDRDDGRDHGRRDRDVLESEIGEPDLDLHSRPRRLHCSRRPRRTPLSHTCDSVVHLHVCAHRRGGLSVGLFPETLSRRVSGGIRASDCGVCCSTVSRAVPATGCGSATPTAGSPTPRHVSPRSQV